MTDVITDEAMAFMRREVEAGEAFYASVHYTAPHSPWYGHPQDIVDSYDDCDFESCPQEEPHPWMAGLAGGVQGRAGDAAGLFRGGDGDGR